ncbi:MAG: hypothetical protein GWN48_19970, partial [Actinobacteria bacterium]|nr:hypothetical protein [Actinomycetota bacterium]
LPSTDVPYGISDSGPQPVSSEIVSAIAAEIVAVRVAIDLTHTYIGDLLVELVSPAGTRV